MEEEWLLAEKQIVERGTDYEALLSCQGWRRILRFLEDRADRALAELRESKFAAPEIVRAKLIAWLNWEEMLDQMQSEAASGVEEYKDLMQQVLTSRDRPGAQAGDFSWEDSLT